MSIVKRRSFFSDLANRDVAVMAEDAIFKKYANHALPTGLQKITGTATPYTGNWTDKEIIHLLRRTTFGVRYDDLIALRSMTVTQAVDYLLNNKPATTPDPPINDYNDEYEDTSGILPGSSWVDSTAYNVQLNWARAYSLKGWWTKQACTHNLSVTEKMVFFWHNHFANEMGVVFDARMTYKQYMLFWTNAMGNYKTLVKEVTKDPSMLKYLNGYLNEAGAPDENYGRELQELFTISKYNTPNYNEDDVKAAAKILTGWRVDQTNVTSYFDPQYHDTTDKQFSSFYNNKLITGKTGTAGAGETDELIDMIFEKQETALYICRRLYRYFVYYLIDSDVETNIIQPLAQTLISNNYEIAPVLKQLLSSNHFYDPNSMGCYIKTPLDVTAGIFRCFNMEIPTTIALIDQHTHWVVYRKMATNMGLEIGDPPNVSGYPAFYQTPEYYQIWINSTTLPARMKFSDTILTEGLTNSTPYTLKIDVLQFASQFASPADPDLLLQDMCTLLLGVDISQDRKDSFKSILLSGQTDNTYWKTAWNNSQTNPIPANIAIVSSRLSELLITLLRLPEFQLC